MGRRLNTHGEYSLLRDLKIYLHRPVVYFCFGIPLLVPSLLLILISILQEGLDVLFLVMASIFLLLAIVTLSMGVAMAYQDRRQTNKMSRNKNMDSLEKSSNDGSSNLQSQTTSSSQTLSYQGTNSNSSLNSTTKNSTNNNTIKTNALLVTILNNNDKTKLVKMKKKSSKRQKRGVKFSVQPMPSLQEEDHHNAIAMSKPGSSTGERSGSHYGNAFGIEMKNKTSNSTSLRRPPGAIGGGDNIDALKDYLSEIGLGKKIIDPEDPPSSTSQLGKPINTEHRQTARSFDDNELAREMLNTDQRTAPFTSRATVASPVATTPRTDLPRLVTVSHERTGLSAGPSYC